jgi:HEAT repeat protein
MTRFRGNRGAVCGGGAQSVGLRPPLACFVFVSIFTCGCGDSRLDELLESAHSSDIDQQRQALRELADLGSEATPAIPDLIELCGDSDADVRRLSGLALSNIATAVPAGELGQRSEIIDVLTKQLDDDEPAVRNTAAFGLLTLDPDHTGAQQRLQVAMREGDGGIIDRLSRTQPPPAWAVPTLIEILTRDQRPGLRRLAAVALGKIDPGGEDAQAALRGALQDSDDRVRGAAEEALGDDR